METIELTPEYNTGLQIDQVFDGNYLGNDETSMLGSLASRVLLESGDWRPYKPSDEWQYNFIHKFDTFFCTNFAYTNTIEPQFTVLRQRGLISDVDWNWLKEKGYLDDQGFVNFSDKALGILAKTQKWGGTMAGVADTARKNGLIPEKMLPSQFNEDTNWEEYADPRQLTAEMKELGLEFLKRFALPYEWYYGNNLREALKAGSQYGGLLTCSPWNVNEVMWCDRDGTNHAISVYEASPHIMDSYAPFIKKLGAGYEVPALMRVLVNPLNGEEMSKWKIGKVQGREEYIVYAKMTAPEALDSLVNLPMIPGVPSSEPLKNRIDWQNIPVEGTLIEN